MKTRYYGQLLPHYVKWRLSLALKAKNSDTTHVIFLFVDHFEVAGKEPRLSEWVERYPRLARQHRDADGASPRHTWFYALDLLREDELDQLRPLVEAGLGEVELHWHHSHDTPDTFREKLLGGLARFQQHGFMAPREAGKAGCFGFVHGNWSLNNSRGAEFCGVDSEIQLLKGCGCYADFTFPALQTRAQPSALNTIHYASFAKGKAGYAQGRRAEVGRTEQEDEFMIFQGPLTVNWTDWRYRWHPMVEDGEVGRSNSHGDPKRIDAWIGAGIHVLGRPEWVFVKIFCHGGQDYRAVLGEETDRMFSYLEHRYNDGVRYRLHYVTAREAYNIVKAAEDGLSGDPGGFRDYVIPPLPGYKRGDRF